MAKVIVTKSKLDALNSAISAKSGVSALRTVDGMTSALSGIVPVAPAVTATQMNPAAASFIEEVTYDPSDSASSQIDGYVTSVSGYDASKPKGVAFSAAAGTLCISDLAAGIVRQETSLGGNKTAYNLTPGNTSSYVIMSGGSVVQAGTLAPTGALRMIKTAATANVRDLGGWACDGGHIKYGKLFRGGEPAAIDSHVLHDECGIRWELNLRGAAEAALSGRGDFSTVGADVRYTCPAECVTYSISDAATWREILGAVFEAVRIGAPLYFHCAAGADRTGTVACVIEAILGASRSDIDKDYELTCFSTGVDTDAHARRRNETEWQTLVGAINSLARGSTFRDKVLWWVASLGFSDSEINAFRSAMTDGAPETISLQRESYTVTKTLSNVTSDGAASATEYLPYAASLVPSAGYVISGVTVTMGGADITGAVFSGTPGRRYFSVTKTPANCTINANNYAEEGRAFVGTITAGTGYTLSSVTITMGGVDVTSTYYSNGTVSIPSATGNIVITATAVASAPQTVTLVFRDGYNCDKTVGSPLNVRAAVDYCITELFDVAKGKTLTLSYDGSVSANTINFVGVDSSGNVTETAQKAFNSGNTPVSYTVTNDATVKMCLRGYHSSFPSFDGHTSAVLTDGAS